MANFGGNLGEGEQGKPPKKIREELNESCSFCGYPVRTGYECPYCNPEQERRKRE